MNQQQEPMDAEVVTETNGKFGDRFRAQQRQEIAVVDPEHSALDMQIATAKHYPRSITMFKRDALGMATLDEETAQSCFFSMPRGGKAIEGPSVRLAEICASAWGHINATAVVSEIGESFVVARAVCWDMERNLRIGFEVRRRITKKNGQRYDDDMIGVTCGAAMSIALRNAIFRVIPRAYVDAIYREARKVAIGDAKTLASRRATMIDYFAKMGIIEARVLAAVEAASVDDVTLDKLALLKGFATAIKDGEASIETCFPEPKKPDAPKESLAEKIKGSDKKADAVAAKTKADLDALAAVASKATPVEGEIPNDPPADAPMSDAEKAAAQAEEAAASFDGETANRDQLLAAIKPHLAGLKWKENKAISFTGFGKRELATCTDAELRSVWRAISKEGAK